MKNPFTIEFCAVIALCSLKEFSTLVRKKMKENGWTDEELDSLPPYDGIENLGERFRSSICSILKEWGGGDVSYWVGMVSGGPL